MDAHDSPTAPPALASLAVLGQRIRRLSTTTLRDAWRLAEAEATLALTAWRLAQRDGKSDAYAVYVAALEREAQAAGLLQSRLAAASRRAV